MIHRTKISGILSSLVTLAVLLTSWRVRAEVALRFDTNRVNQLSVAQEVDGVISFKTLGEDPFILLEPIQSAEIGESLHALAFEYFCPDGVSDLEVFYGPPIVAGQSISAGELRRAESWQPFTVDLKEASGGRWLAKFNLLRLDFGKRPGVELRVRNLRLRSLDEAERSSAATREAIRQRKTAAAELVMRYLDTPTPVRIESVAVTHDQIRIKGTVTGELGELELIEVQPWQELWRLLDGKAELLLSPDSMAARPRGPTEIEQSGFTSAATIAPTSDGAFTATILRFDGTRDRLTSRWGVVASAGGEPSKLVSCFVHPTDLTEACEHPDLDLKIAGGIKGMGGVWANDILEELVELGVKHVTDNMWISDLLSPESREGWSTFTRNGRSWWVNPRVVDGHDRLIKFATDHGMLVSAIVLVGFGESGFAKLLQHPEAVRAGQYAMPNLATREGAETYEAAIAFLAQRYAQPGDPYGRITNWILHNEVDYGWEWSNMGAQPLAVYLDTYVRSMRIVHTLARQFNPHARVFISLTHNWDVPDDPAWKTYGPRRMLETLVKFSRVEGDFEWGVAYHPYPQSLFKSDAWNDTLPTDNFDTPLITPKNIAVLDLWMHRSEMLFQGKPRGVLLSEQGYHTPDYSEASQRLQAAAFVYTWHKLRGLKSIEAFHNHRWVDHPQEGGLKLGLRTLPADSKPYGDRKFAWEIYQALDTPDEAMKTEFAKEIIGVKGWDEIQYRPER